MQSGISSEQKNCEDSNDVSDFTITCIINFTIKGGMTILRAQLKSIPGHISKCFLALVNQSESQNWSRYTNSLLHLSPSCACHLSLCTHIYIYIYIYAARVTVLVE